VDRLFNTPHGLWKSSTQLAADEAAAAAAVGAPSTTEENPVLSLAKQRCIFIETPVGDYGTPSAKELLWKTGQQMFALLVDKQKWHENAGRYGADNDGLLLCRASDLIDLLEQHTVTRSILFAHRDRHLDANNKKLLGSAHTSRTTSICWCSSKRTTCVCNVHNWRRCELHSVATLQAMLRFRSLETQHW